MLTGGTAFGVYSFPLVRKIVGVAAEFILFAIPVTTHKNHIPFLIFKINIVPEMPIQLFDAAS